MVIAAMKFQDPCSWKESYDKPTDDTTLTAGSEELKSLFMQVKQESENLA